MKVMINREIIVKLQCAKCGNVVTSEHELVMPYTNDKNYRCRNCDNTEFHIINHD